MPSSFVEALNKFKTYLSTRGKVLLVLWFLISHFSKKIDAQRQKRKDTNSKISSTSIKNHISKMKKFFEIATVRSFLGFYLSLIHTFFFRHRCLLVFFQQFHLNNLCFPLSCMKISFFNLSEVISIMAIQLKVRPI